VHNVLGKMQESCRDNNNIQSVKACQTLFEVYFHFDNLLHSQIGHPRTSTLPHGQPIRQTGGHSSGQSSEWINENMT